MLEKLVDDWCRRRLTIKEGGKLCIEWHASDSRRNASDLRWWDSVFYNQLSCQIHVSAWLIGLQLRVKL